MKGYIKRCIKRYITGGLKIVEVVSLMVLPLMMLGQISDPLQTQNSIEDMADRSMNETEHPEWIEDLSDLAEHPVNLNNTSIEELMTIPGITQRQAENILNYVMNYGQFLSAYELSSVSGFDSIAISRIFPYITIGSGPSAHPLKLKKIISEGHGRFMAGYQQVMQKQAGYKVADSVISEDPEAGYAGSPQRLNFRLEYNYYDRLSIGFGGEKDAGEQFFRGEQKYGMDYYYGYLRLRHTGFLEDLVIGNFRVDFGQGLVMGSGSAFGVAAGSAELMRCQRGVRPSLSANETSFLRGIAASLKFGQTGISLFWSDHETESNGKESVAGGNLIWKNRFMSAGITCVYSHYGLEKESGNDPYQFYKFSGKENLNAGVDFRATAGNFYFFGEVGRSLNRGWAWLGGMQFTPDPTSSLSLLYRDYQPSYQDLFSSASGRNLPNANERGFLLKANIQAAKRLMLRGYADIYSFPWLKYRTDLLSKGSEFIAEGELQAVKGIILVLRFRCLSSQQNLAAGDANIRKWENRKSYNIRVQADWQVSQVFRLRSRMEVIETHREQGPAGHGYLLLQDFIYKPVKFPVSVFFRYAIFDTDSWDERIYAYEQDVLYGYSVPALDGSGIRCCVMLAWKISRKIDIVARLTQVWYTDRQTIGSGLNEIEGDVKSEIKIQGKIRF